MRYKITYHLESSHKIEAVIEAESLAAIKKEFYNDWQSSHFAIQDGGIMFVIARDKIVYVSVEAT